MNGFYWESDWKGLSREGQVLADQPIHRRYWLTEAIGQYFDSVSDSAPDSALDSAPGARLCP